MLEINKVLDIRVSGHEAEILKEICHQVQIRIEYKKDEHPKYLSSSMGLTDAELIDIQNFITRIFDEG